jgi:hypothetical protein
MPHRRRFWSILCFSACLAGCGARPTAEQAEAIAAIERLGGKVKFADDRPARPVVEIALGGTAVSDADLARLACFPDLETLALFDSGVGDAGVAHLKPLANLRTLYLGRTKVTDAGLDALAGMTRLKTLGLSDTRVTDAGLLRLTHLQQLASLNLRRTPTTEAGVRQLKESLPKLVVHR